MTEAKHSFTPGPDDLVKRLRDMAAFQSATWTGKVYVQLWRDAADEIETLRSQLADAALSRAQGKSNGG